MAHGRVWGRTEWVDRRKLLRDNGLRAMGPAVFDFPKRVDQLAAGMLLEKSEVAQLGKRE